MSRIAIIDVSYLCHRARFTTGALSHEGVRTGVVFGFLRDMRILKDALVVDTFVFAFDGGQNKRKDICPAYKANRDPGNLTPEEKMELDDYHMQVIKLRKELLPQIGFQNLFCETGFEGDDIIARVAADESTKGNECVIVSSDHDLYQCLNDRVSIYNPTSKVEMGVLAFVEEYGVSPTVWHQVKAIAGCGSDNVKGVAGVGEKTAVLYLTGKLKPALKKYRDIEKNDALISHNRRLVKLPFFDTPHFEVRPDAVTERGWNEVEASIGLRAARAKAVPNKPGGFF